MWIPSGTHVEPVWCVMSSCGAPTHVSDTLYTRKTTGTIPAPVHECITQSRKERLQQKTPPRQARDMAYLRGSTASPLARSFAALLLAAPEPQPRSVSAFHEPGGHPLFPDACSWGGPAVDREQHRDALTKAPTQEGTQSVNVGCVIPFFRLEAPYPGRGRLGRRSLSQEVRVRQVRLRMHDV